MTVTRRAVVGLLPAALIFPALAADLPPVPASGKLAFSVWRKGSRIGSHSVDFRQSGTTLTVETNAHFAVGLGPIALYRYTYHVVETWTGGQLVGLVATTDDNGTRGTCTAKRDGDRLMVSGSKSGHYPAPAHSIAGTHWNKAEIDAQMINPENGTLMTFAVADKGTDAPPDGRGTARHYALSGFATLDIWWDDQDTWVGLRATAKDKSIIDYRRA